MDKTQLKQAARPDEIRAALNTYADELGGAAAPHHHAGDDVDVRTARYKGHDIVVRTRYEITVDGRPFDVRLSVANTGRVHYHGLPTRDFGSAIDLVQKAIDVFGEEFADEAGHDHGDHPHDADGGPHDSDGGH